MLGIGATVGIVKEKGRDATLGGLAIVRGGGDDHGGPCTMDERSIEAGASTTKTTRRPSGTGARGRKKSLQSGGASAQRETLGASQAIIGKTN
ncbi:hypothetical protein HHA04nite_25160 [Halomonas halophila]|uniref:Uncharacterized protein n=1 Tax=Halomonas halophila TaxID=29573 RepID=A0ABQ0U621_9GAMM|nr:hypothetical protein HHA04nite_25160 [Halomonas halophila]